MSFLEVEFESKWAALIRGPASWQLCRDAAHRRPVWSRKGRGWIVTERTARDVVAAAEQGGLNVVVVGPRAAGLEHQDHDVDQHQDHDVEEPGLW